MGQGLAPSKTWSLPGDLENTVAEINNNKLESELQGPTAVTALKQHASMSVLQTCSFAAKTQWCLNLSNHSIYLYIHVHKMRGAPIHLYGNGTILYAFMPLKSSGILRNCLDPSLYFLSPAGHLMQDIKWCPKVWDTEISRHKSSSEAVNTPPHGIHLAQQKWLLALFHILILGIYTLLSSHRSQRCGWYRYPPFLEMGEVFPWSALHPEQVKMKIRSQESSSLPAQLLEMPDHASIHAWHFLLGEFQRYKKKWGTQGLH